MKNPAVTPQDCPLPPPSDARPRAGSGAAVWSHLLVLLGYSLLTLVLTWPALRYFNTAIPGDGFDGWQNYWNLWWVKQALLVRGNNPFFTDTLYAPTGVSLLFHTLNIFNSLWTLPLQLNAGLTVTYNSIVLISFVLAGYGGYLLALYTLAHLYRPLGRAGRPAAFLGGLVFTMAPFHMAHLLGHMQVFSMIWPPFYILALLRALEPWTGPAPGRPGWRPVFMAGLCLVLASLVDWYHTLYLLLFTGLVLPAALFRHWQNRATAPFSRALYARPLIQTAAILLIFGLALSPLLGPMVREAGRRPDLQTGLAQNLTLSADLLAFITPSELHPWWGAWAGQVANNFSSTTSERLIFAGFGPLALALVALVHGWSRPAIRFWAFGAAAFFGLALGPYLHVAGQLVTIAGRPLPLPYLLLYHTVPFIGLTRSLSRYDLVVMLCLGVLAAAGTYRLASTARKKRAWWPYAAVLLVCFEFLAVPYPVSRVEIPAFYFQMASQPESYTVAELPMNWDRPTPLLHQTVHGKDLLTAYTSRDNPLELAWRTPVFQHWRYLSADIIDQPLDRIAPTIFFDFNLRYILLDFWQMPPGPEREGTTRWVEAALPGTAPVYDDGRLVVYQAPPPQGFEPYLALGQGWSERQESDPGSLTRSFTTGGRRPEIFLHHPQNLPLTLEITAAAPAGQVALTVLAGEKPVGLLQPGPAWERFSFNLPPSSEAWIKLSLGSDGPPVKVTVSRLGLSRGK